MNQLDFLVAAFFFSDRLCLLVPSRGTDSLRDDFLVCTGGTNSSSTFGRSHFRVPKWGLWAACCKLLGGGTGQLLSRIRVVNMAPRVGSKETSAMLVG